MLNFRTVLSSVLVVVMSVIMTGCGTGTAVNDISAFRKVDLQEAENMPSKEELKNPQMEVVVMELDNNGFEDAERANIGATIEQELTGYIRKADADVVSDRDVPESLKKEVRYTQQKGKGEGRYTGKTVADFAVRGTVSQVNFSSSFSEDGYYENDDGEQVYVPPSCNYEAKVTATVEVYRLPQLDVIESFEIDSTTNSSTELDSSGTASDCTNFSSSMYQGAAKEAVKLSRTKVQNFFAPRGFVMERRMKDKDNIFKVTIGEKRGVKEGKKAEIIKIVRDKNPLSGEVVTEQRTIATGVFTNRISPESSWIRVSDPKKANRVRLGHQVSLVFEQSMGESIQDTFDTMQSTL